MNIYRGFEYGYRNANSITASPEGYYFLDADDEAQGPFRTDEACMEGIDAYCMGWSHETRSFIGGRACIEEFGKSWNAMEEADEQLLRYV